MQKFTQRVTELEENGYVQLDYPFERPHVETISSYTGEGATSSDVRIGGGEPSITDRYSMFDAKQSSIRPVRQTNRKSTLGYIPWGPMDNLPNQIFRYASSLPYTATALQYLIDLTVGLGPKLMYRWTHWTGGSVKTDLIPWEDAGVMLRAKIAELKEKGGGSTYQFPISGKAVDINNKELQDAMDELAEWERTDAEVRQFMDNNNLEHHFQQCMTDYAHLGIFFPTYGLSRGRAGYWNPKIAKVSYIPAICARFEQ
ncbi:MAG: hypothetical protein ACI4C3_00330, partial [Bacteroides sp.]